VCPAVTIITLVLKAFIFRHRVAAFEQIRRQDMLDLPSHDCFKFTPRCFPGAGDEVTSVTIMQMDAGLDTGPILA